MVQFFETPMGRTFYDRSVPRLVEAVERIAKVLELRWTRDERFLQPVDGIDITPAPVPVRYTAHGAGECEECGKPYAIGDGIVGMHVWIPEEHTFDSEVDAIVCSPTCAERRRR
jgi:hypothetical protein